MTKKQLLVAREVAEDEFDRMCEAMGVDLDEFDDLDDEDRKQFDQHKKRIVRAITTGLLTVDEDGLPTIHPSKGDSAQWKPPTGGTLVTLDRFKSTDNVRRVFEVAKEMTGGKLKAGILPLKEVGVITSMVALFLAI